MTGARKKLSRKELGRWGEGIARDYLLDCGLTFIDQNYRTADGEIDLIMKDQSTLVFVEVKTRYNILSGLPEEAVDELQENVSFTNDLDADSIQLMELVMSIEDEFEIEIPDSEIENVKTVGDLVKYIEANKA